MKLRGSGMKLRPLSHYDREQLKADRAAGEAGDPEPPPRFYWIDAFCASQVSIAGVPLTTK